MLWYCIFIIILTHCYQEAKGDSKKRVRPPAATRTKESTKSSDDEQAPVAKRGRGRPKGSKKKAAAKGKVQSYSFLILNLMIQAYIFICVSCMSMF